MLDLPALLISGGNAPDQKKVEVYSPAGAGRRCTVASMKVVIMMMMMIMMVIMMIMMMIMIMTGQQRGPHC